MKFALKIDEKNCWGCKACEVVCKLEHRTPEGVKLLRVNEQWPDKVNADQNQGWQFAVNICRHCEDPPCAAVCPSQAITKRDNGIVVLDRQNCEGCGACLDACPYNAIFQDQPGDIVWKCNMCIDRIEKGLIPACADNVCMAHCIYFGDAKFIDRMILEKTWLKHRLKGELGAMVISVDD